MNNLNGVLRRSNLLCCISDSMAREYEARYSTPTATFMRCVPTHAGAGLPPVQADGALRLMYVGGLHLQRGRILEMVGEAVTRLRQEGIAAVLTIYAPANDARAWKARLDRPGIVEVAGTLAAQSVPAMLATAHVLVHVESFDEETVRFTRLSLSTKLPEYLSAGRAILAIGPRGLSSIEYIRDSGSGLVVETETPEAVMAAVRRLASDNRSVRLLGDAARRTARARHDSRQQRDQFRAVLTQAAHASNPSDFHDVREALDVA
jgi:glycosyltransferase involved in cell wall biosynthesis